MENLIQKNFKEGCQNGNLKVRQTKNNLNESIFKNELFVHSEPVNLFGSCPIFYEGELGISLFWLGVSYSGAAELGVYSSSQQVPNCNVQKGKVLSKQQSPSLVPPSDIDYTVLLQEAGAATLTTSKLRLCSNKVDSQPTTTIHFLCGKRSLFSLPRNNSYFIKSESDFASV